MKLRATIRIRQDFLIEKREELQMSQKEFADAVGVSVAVIGRAERLDFSSTGTGFLGDMRKIADFLCVDLGKIFPKELRGLKLETTKVAKAEVPIQNMLSGNQVLRLKRPEEIIEEQDLKSQVAEVLETLTTQEALIIKNHFGFNGGEILTDRKMASIEKTYPGRIKVLRDRALYKLRNPKRLRILGRLKEALKNKSDQ